MKKNYLLFILLLSCLNIYSQSNYEAGTIVTVNADTLKGYIHSGVNNANPKFCLFKNNLNEDPVRYTPSELSSFQINNRDKYISISYLNKRKVAEQIFALVLEEGRASLYFHKSIYYVKKQEGEIVKLDNNEITIIKEGTEYRKKTRYIGILSYLLSDYPQLRSQIQRIKYSGKDISRIINKYNTKFNDSNSVSKSKTPWSIVEFGGYVSTSFSRPEYSTAKNRHSNHLTDANWELSQQLGCGLFLESRYMRVLKNWAIHLEAQVQKITHSASAEILYGSTKFIYDNNSKYYSLNLPIGIKYYQNYKGFKTYIMGGVYYNKTFSDENKTSGILINSNNVFTLPNVKSYEQISNSLGFWLSIGLRKKVKRNLDLFSEIRYYQNNKNIISYGTNTFFIAKQKNINIGLHIGLYF